MRLRQPAHQGWVVARFQHHDVRLEARCEPADPVVHTERDGVAEGDGVEGVERVPALALELAHPVAVRQRLQHREAGAGAHVRTHRQAHARALERGQIT